MSDWESRPEWKDTRRKWRSANFGGKGSYGRGGSVNRLRRKRCGEKNWLGKMAGFERILPRRASVLTAIRRNRTPRRPTDEVPALTLFRLNRNSVQARDQLKVPDIGCSHSIAEFQRTHPGQQIR